jgi:predicted nucleic-acid-binding protein
VTGIDTNVLVRCLMQDDARQAIAANAFLDSLTHENPGFVGLVTMAELCWVLMRRYKLSRDQFAGALDWLINAAFLQFENQGLIADALLLFEETNADFADCLVSLSAKAAGCASIVTFDLRS